MHKYAEHRKHCTRFCTTETNNNTKAQIITEVRHRTAFTDYHPERFFSAIRFLLFVFYFSVFGVVRQIKLALPLAFERTKKYHLVSYRIVSFLHDNLFT